MTNTLDINKYDIVNSKIDRLIELSDQEQNNSYDTALNYALEALELIKTISNKERECYIYYFISNIYCYKGQFKLALEYANLGKELISLTKDSFVKYKIYNILGVIYFNFSEYINALNNFFKALEFLKEEEDKYQNEISGLYLNIANICFRNKDYAHALEALDDSIKIMKQIQSEFGLYLCYNTYGNIYIELEEVEKAETYYQKALFLAEKIANLTNLATIYNNLAQVYEKKKELKKALKFVSSSLRINKQLNREAIIAIDYRRIGIINFELNQIEEGIEFLEKAYILSYKLEDKTEALLSVEELADYCAKAKRWEEAYQYRTKHSELRDEIFNEQKAKTVSELQIRHQLERKKRETELLKASEERIRLYADKLEDSNRELERFAHVASHDMKEPLRMIHSYLGLISKKVKKYEDEVLNEFLHYAVDGANRMQNLITEMLKLAQLSKDTTMKSVDINDVILLVFKNLETIIQEKNAVLKYENLPIVTGNIALLTQLFQNLIGNGIKYNRSEKPTITIRVNETETAYHFEIEDNGIGIKEEDYKRVFEMLTRLNNRTEFEGTGIGLATCKRIVEKHNGRIWVTSEYGEGSNFQFFLQK